MRVRFSIGWLMVVVVLAAVDFGIARTIEPPGGPLYVDSIAAMLVATPIMLNVLGISGFVAIRSLSRRGESGPFLSGFVTFGTLAMVVVTATIMAFPDPIFDPIVAAIKPGFGPFQGRMSDDAAEMLGLMIVSTVVTVPQLLCAVVGGLLNRRLGGFMIVTVRRLRHE